MVWKIFFKEFYDGCLMLSLLCHVNGMILGFLCTLAACRPHQVSAQVEYGLEDDYV